MATQPLQPLVEQYFANPTERNRSAVIVEGVHLVRSLVGRTSVPKNPLASREDLESVGLMGLLQALEQYDVTRGTPFATFAYGRIRGALIDYLRSIDPLSRDQRRKLAGVQAGRETLRQMMGDEPSDEDVAIFLGLGITEYYELLAQAQRRFALSLHSILYEDAELTLIDLIPDDEAEATHEQLEFRSIVEYVQSLIRTLTEREQRIIALYFYESLTLREIAGLLGLTEARISQILGKTLLGLRARMHDMRAKAA